MVSTGLSKLLPVAAVHVVLLELMGMAVVHGSCFCLSVAVACQSQALWCVS
jgi:hypothetical protein